MLTQNSKDLNIILKIVTHKKENREGKLHGIGLGNDFLDMTMKVKTTKAKTGKWDYIKPKNFVTINSEKVA